ncbi:YetF domain-containing protein [Halomonas sp. M4R1S46]|uniref:YetF domain-containing protein n=1 Tax=Halomonas sp. M4R1S46 TaxID=2982692 RepID=UPI00398F45AB
MGAAAGNGGAPDALYCGEFLPAALRQARVTEDEVRVAVRSAGVDSLEKMRAFVLETDGSFSVVRQGEGGNGSSLVGVDGPRSSGSPSTVILPTG